MRKPGYVYFLAADSANCIKIGHSINPKARLRHHQKQTPVRLRLICQVRGSLNDEQRIHKKFMHTRKWGEWFSSHGSLPIFIRHLKRLGRVPKNLEKFGFPISILQVRR